MGPRRGHLSADRDLPWFFGDDARQGTAGGDLGLRSALGGQLAAAKAATRRARGDITDPAGYPLPPPSPGPELRRFGFPWEDEEPRVSESEVVYVNDDVGAVDVSAVEDALLELIGAADRVRRVEARLRQLSPTYVAVLRAHYSGETLPYGIDLAARFLRLSRELLERLAVKEEILDSAESRWRAIRAERGEAPRAGPVPTEVMRQALHDATEAERQAITTAADKLVEEARAAFEAIPGERPARRVQVDDPRRWKQSRR